LLHIVVFDFERVAVHSSINPLNRSGVGHFKPFGYCAPKNGLGGIESNFPVISSTFEDGVGGLSRYSGVQISDFLDFFVDGKHVLSGKNETFFLGVADESQQDIPSITKDQWHKYVDAHQQYIYLPLSRQQKPRTDSTPILDP
jgi:hypothetical protein